MALREYALGGVYFSPLLLYLMAGIVVALVLRFVLYRLLGSSRLWYEAWLDTSLVVLCTAVIAWLGARSGV